MKYPGGQAFNQLNSIHPAKRVNYGSRGMSLEEKINQSNQYYLQKNRAVIHKKPTPIQVVKVDYPKRSAARISEAYYRHASTTDYNGVYQQRYIDFEAKETTNKQSFPLSNIPQHQIEHMRQCQAHGGICFLLIAFSAHQAIYLLPFDKLAAYLDQPHKQSIPLTYIQANGILCQQGAFPLVDYLSALDQLLHH